MLQYIWRIRMKKAINMSELPEAIGYENVMGGKYKISSPRAFPNLIERIKRGTITKIVIYWDDDLEMAGAREDGKWIYLRSPKEYLFRLNNPKAPEIWSLKYEPVYLTKDEFLKKLQNELLNDSEEEKNDEGTVKR